MGWRDDAWKQRFWVSLHKTAAIGADEDVEIDIPQDFDWFWDNCDDDGDDIMLCEADGVTRMTVADGNIDTGWDFKSTAGAAFSKGNRIGGIRLDGWNSAPQGAGDVNSGFWVYFNKTTPASLADGVFAGTDTFTARDIVQTHLDRGGVRIKTRPELPGATAPSRTLVKTTNETLFVYWDLRNELLGRQYRSYARTGYEEVQEAYIVATQAGGAAAGQTTQNLTRILTHGAVVRTAHAAGTVDLDYTLRLKVQTTLGRILERRALLSVRDPDDQ